MLLVSGGIDQADVEVDVALGSPAEVLLYGGGWLADYWTQLKLSEQKCVDETGFAEVSSTCNQHIELSGLLDLLPLHLLQ